MINMDQAVESKNITMALYAGSFDPPHIGHLWVARQILERLADEVVVIPSYLAPWKDRHLTSAQDRAHMCSKTFKYSGMSVSMADIDNEFECAYETVSHFKRKYPNKKIKWVIGWDWASKIRGFVNYRELEKLCSFILVTRPPYSNPRDEFLNVEVFDPPIQMAISSSEIRSRVEAGKSIEGLILPDVRGFIYSKGLYRNLPKYVSISGVALALNGINEQGAYYYRDAGQWGVNVIINDSKLIVKDNNPNLSHLDGSEAIETTQEEWARDNEGYL